MMYKQETATQKKVIAAPQSLSNHIPLNAFHPIYRSLFEYRDAHVQLNAWDHVTMAQLDRSALSRPLNTCIQHYARLVEQHLEGTLAKAYMDAFTPLNAAMTALLPGDIEFLHTAPFPSFTRPFVLHCEMFAPLLYPFSHQGEGGLKNAAALKQFFGSILGSDLCLGIFSHIPETLRDIAIFFDTPAITAKLKSSRIGLSHHLLPTPLPTQPDYAVRPKFLFINSAHQNPNNFTKRGGHLVLRFWQKMLQDYPDAILYMRCRRPSNRELESYHVDTAFVDSQSGRSIQWIEEFVTDAELNQLFHAVHFFLLPSLSLHSASIMQAMALGAVPVVTDTIGTSTYVQPGHNGIVLNGMYANLWFKDPLTGVMMDKYGRNPTLEDNMVAQMVAQIGAVIAGGDSYHAMRAAAIQTAQTQFSGDAFRQSFWGDVAALIKPGRQSHAPVPASAVHLSGMLSSCLVKEVDWTTIFTSVPQPVMRIHTGATTIHELGGAFILCPTAQPIHLHDWSPLKQALHPTAPPLLYYRSIAEMDSILGNPSNRRQRIKVMMLHVLMAASRMLEPFPAVHGFAKKCYHAMRRFWWRL